MFLFSIDRDAQLLANRIALLKQEEMKTWKKIEETKKRTNDISGLKKRNEEKVQKVSTMQGPPDPDPCVCRKSSTSSSLRNRSDK